MESRTLLAAVFWTGAAGDNQWTTAHNWSTKKLPGSADDVTINVAGNPTIMLASGTQSIHSLVSGDPLQLTGGTLAVTTTAQLSAKLTLAGGTLSGGTYETSNGSVLLLTTAGGTLDGVTMDCNIDATGSGAFAQVLGGLVLNATALIGGPGAILSGLEFDGTQTLSGAGTVLLGSAFAGGAVADASQLPIEPGLFVTQSGSTLTLGPNITVRGAGSVVAGAQTRYAVIGYAPNGPTDVSVVNQGTIQAEPVEMTPTIGALGIVVYAQTFTNVGTAGYTGASVFGVSGTAEIAGGNAIIDGGAGNVTISGGEILFGNDPFGSAGGGPPPPEFPLGTAFVEVPSITLSTQAVLNVPKGQAYIISGPLVFSGSNSAIDIASDNTTPSGLIVTQDVEFTSGSGSAGIYSTGTGTIPAILDLGNVPPDDGTSSAARDFTVNGTPSAADLVISAKIYGGALRKDGTGELELKSPNAYSGGTTIANGVTQIDDPAALGSGPVTFAGGMLAPRIGGVAVSNALMVDASDTIALDVGANAVQVTAPALGSALDVIGSASGSLTLTGPIALQNNLDIDNTVPLAINGAISGSFGITKTDTGTLTLAGSASNTYSGATTVSGGTLLLDDATGTAAIPGTLAIVPFAGAGIATSATVRLLAGQQLSSSAALNFDSTNGAATLDLNGFNQSVQSLTIANSGGSAIIGDGPTNTAASATLGVSSLAIASGQTLDLTGNNLQVSYTTGNDPIASIRQYLSNGYGGGTWNGTGTGSGRIISSTAAAAGRTLGYADSVDKIVAGVAPNTILIKYTIPGDANLDGSVNFSDLVILAQHYGANATWDQGDFSYGGKVNFADLVALAQHYNKSVSSSAVAASASLTPAIETAAGTSDTSTRSRHRPLRHSRHRT